MEPPLDLTRFSMEEFLEALKKVETGSSPDGRLILGDRGLARGPLQIHRGYHTDAVGSLFDYDKVDYLRFAIRCFYGYMARYVPTALMNNDFETLARVHNGGPRGHYPMRRRYTDSYWQKVLRELAIIEQGKFFPKKEESP